MADNGVPLTLGAVAALAVAGAVAARGSAARSELPTQGWLPTGLGAPFNTALGGGWPLGRVVEISGPRDTAEAMALHAVAQAQAAGETAAFVDAAHALDPVAATEIGVSLQSLLVAQPSNLAQALDVTEQLVRSSAVRLVVVNLDVMPTTEGGPPIATSRRMAYVPQARAWGQEALPTARLMSQALRKLTAVAHRLGVLVLFVRSADLELGNALKFYASVRVQIVGEPGAYEARTVKNKLAPPFQTVPVSGLE